MMINNIIAPLNIYIVWHPTFDDGIKYARSFYTLFNRDINDPLSRGIGIPLYFRTGNVPLDIDTSKSEHTAVVLLVNDEMVIDDTWKEYINGVVDKIQNSKSIIYPVALTENSFSVSSKLPNKNFIRLFTEREPLRYLQSMLTHELCRLLFDKERINDISDSTAFQSPPPLKMFISHAKEDGVDTAKQLSDFIQSSTPLKTFFDANDIAIGYDFPQEIEANIQNSVLLVIHSDKYSSREWCRKEIIIAKKYNRPIIVINFFDEGEDRSFPYMANLKNIRINNISDNMSQEFERIFHVTLKETLRFKYHQLYIKYLALKYKLDISENAIMSYPPELLSLVFMKDIKHNLTIYPDPPLGDEEIQLINSANKKLQFITPTFIPLINKIEEEEFQQLNFLSGKTVGISISESQNIDKFGLENHHLQDTLVEFARYLLVSGATLAYGGDIKYDSHSNFNEILFNLARNYLKENKRPSEKILNYVCYPLYTKIPVELKANLNEIATFIDVVPTFKVPDDPSVVFEAKEVENQYIWARSLTEMREKMNSNIHARIIVGGKLTGYSGILPGVVEEAYIGMKNKKPVYLIGAMGGAANSIIDAIKGLNPYELTEKYQITNSKYPLLRDYYNSRMKDEGLDTVEYNNIISFFNEKGFAGLNNGLSSSENEILFNTTNTTEMISLVLKGLRSI
ncbi:TIR domain-containing protein [Paenibacillus polymyxa]|uniref:TIR domain-containing protein n=1 Tax=Paenibacillus polymyxa TaxID=1406 RepID=UPI002AB53957|nr:TIR domain-containing protein [Paenibacillus polymyxa]MDY8045216.1 TIR domain-containing protein [Paenibacillus polymyxa]